VNDTSATALLSFYAWEERGRGWRVWPHPVDLEPPFRPAGGLGRAETVVDDGRRPSRLGSWLGKLLGASSPRQLDSSEDIEEPEPEPSVSFDVVEFQVALPPETKVTSEAAEHFLLSLSTCSESVSFELVGTSEAVVVLVAASDRDAVQVRLQLGAHFPDAVITEAPLYLEKLWRTETCSLVVDFGLSQEFMRPLRTFSRFDPDPLTAIVGAMSELGQCEVAVFQVMFQATRSPWPPSIMQAVTSWDGQSFFEDAPDLAVKAGAKVSRPLFAAVARLAVQAETTAQAWEIARRLGSTLALFADPDGNELIALTNEDYADSDHAADVVRRRSRRSGMLLNSEELLSLVHLPSASVRSEMLRRDEGRTRAAPHAVSTEGLMLGENLHAGKRRPVALTDEQRLRHTHVVGASGTGKSTLLLRMIIQDVEQGRGLAILDPHGDLIDDVLCRVPESRRDDVILVDPSDIERPVGFNVLAAHSELEKTLLSSDLVAIFRRLSTSWGDQMTSVLGNAILAFLESTKGGTLADLRRFLVEADFRSHFLNTVRDPEVVYYWRKEFPLLTGKPQAPLLTRLDAFLRPRLVRGMVSQESSIDFASVMDQGKILLVKLSQGAIGQENAALLGSMFLSKLHQLALGRQSLAEQARRPFYLYCDEFQHFITPSMATLLTGARKYRLGLVLAHQELRQLWNQDRDVAGAVLANAATRICFRVGDEDAKTLEDGFGHFSARDLQNLGRGQAIVRIDRAEWDFSIQTELLPATTEADRERRAEVVALSRERHGATPTVYPIDAVAGTQPPPATLSGTRTPKRSPPQAQPRTSPDTQPVSASSVLPGRGGPQHKYLQELIKRWAEANGWRAEIEKSILDGLGRVDVALERGDVKVACEISVSSTVDYEISNVRKCLAAGCSAVAIITVEHRSIDKLKRAIAKEIDIAESERVRVLSPDELFEFLDQLPARAAATERTTKGYRVKVSSSQRGRGSSASKAVAQTVVDALRRLRSKS
jgi:Type IV secretion-system coupling protein DNA-binding domain